MNWNLYSALNSYGDMYKLNSSIGTKKILADIETYKDFWQKYNPSKPHIPRDSLAVTSYDGSMKEEHNTSLSEHYHQTGNNIEESDFNQPTDLFKSSDELQKLLNPWKDFLARTQFIRIPQGGYFPAHIDGGRKFVPETFRLIVPVDNVNPPNMWWMLGDDTDYCPLKWETGNLYYLNTMKKHALFNTSSKDSIWLIINIVTTEESVQKVRSLI